METKEKPNRFMQAEKVELPKSKINIQEIENMANAIKPEENNKVIMVKAPMDIPKLKGLTIKLTDSEYKAMYARKMEISTDLTVQEYVANLIRKDIKL
jgi:hypothetical protein